MKTIEEKAKAYDEARKRAIEMHSVHSEVHKGVTEYIFPELAESEDERIRKALVKQFGGCIKDHEFCHTGFTYAEITAWLEKQKEHVPENEESGTRKEQKSTPDWMPKFLDELRSMRNYFDWDEHKEIEGQILAIINWIAPNYFKEKEQKPNPLCGSTEEYYREAYYADQPQKEQKPVEWSEIEDIADHLDNLGNTAMADTLRRFRPQKQEWSEEDEKMLNGIIGRGCSQIPYTEPGLRGEQIDWLKNKLKYLRPQPHWKPSEEQMEALHKAFKKAYHDYDARPLESLYSDLLKLK